MCCVFTAEAQGSRPAWLRLGRDRHRLWACVILSHLFWFLRTVVTGDGEEAGMSQGGGAVGMSQERQPDLTNKRKKKCRFSKP